MIVTTLISLVAIVAFLGIAYVATNKPQQQESPTLPSKLASLSPTDHTKWSKNKKILLIEYGDLQCPSCQSAHDFMKRLESSDKKEDKQIMAGVTFVWRHFPLLTVHPHAQAAAHAAEAAGAQDKFFEMADVLFENQADWASEGNPQAHFEGYAKDLKLDGEKFKADMKSKKIKDRVEADRLGGLEAGVASTPSFFLSGVRVEAAGFDQMRTLLLEAVTKK